MVWFRYFILYSFVGFLLEVAFARITGGRPDRKCLLVLPLCPVYGLGSCAILLLPDGVKANPLLLFAAGGALASWAEYLTASFYERVLGVSFWDYQGLPGSIHGRVCLPFSLAWGLLSLPLVYWLHPLLIPYVKAVPPAVAGLVMAAAVTDGLLSAALLRRTGDRNCLKWYSH